MTRYLTPRGWVGESEFPSDEGGEVRYVPTVGVANTEREREHVAGLVNWGRFGNHPTDVIGYTFDADYHCPVCTALRFGLNDQGWVPEDATDSEGNEVHPIFGDAEWWNLEEGCERLSCSDCHSEIDRVHCSTCEENLGEDPCDLEEDN